MRRQLAWACGVMIALGSPSAGNAQFYGNFISGNVLHKFCAKDREDASCSGYILGVTDASIDFQTARAFMKQPRTAPCFREGISPDQVVDIAARYLEAHPEKRDGGAHGLVLAALQEAFPCTQP